MNMEHQVMVSHHHMGLDDYNPTMDVEPRVADDDEMLENYGGRDYVTSEIDPNLEPYIGMEFESEESAKAFYNSYAKLAGFSTRVSVHHRSRRDGAIICREIVCAKEGFRPNKDRGNEGKVKRPRAVTRTGCKAMIMAKRNDETGKWVVTKFEKEHNHELEGPDRVHCLRSHRHISNNAKSLIGNMLGAGIGPTGIMSVFIKESGGVSKVGFTERDCKNYCRVARQRNLGGDVQSVLDYLRRMQAENPAFYYAIQGDEHQFTGNVFWADARSRMAYNYFGDAVTFDTTYKTNRYRIPFAPFTGLNHHRQPVLFGCALLLDESESSYVWLFRTWLEAMSGRHPISITTDQDKGIRTAVAHVFPETRHRFYKWHILREVQEKLSHVYRTYPTFQADFHKCINSTETVEEFESCWMSLLDRYDIRQNEWENEWFQSLYNVRRQWVPVYLRDTFFGEMYATQQNESINSFFDGFVNAQTTLQALFTQYERAVDSRHEKEEKADSDTINTKPVFKTPSPMEKQAAGLYTRKIFMEFQDELIDTLVYTANKIDEDGAISTYRVAKFEAGHKAFMVTFNVFEMRASCSCQMFEFSGILCRHILTVFKVRNVLTLPSHYILKRWTRNAKSWLAMDDRGVELQGDCREALTMRYTNLRHEAIKYAEEGAASSDIYNIAMNALQEAMNKVAAAKKNIVTQLGTLVGGSNQKDYVSEGSQVDNMAPQLTFRDPQQNIGGIHLWGSLQSRSMDDRDREIQELTYDLEHANRICEAYRTHLLMFLKDIGEHEQNLSKKARIREIENEEDDSRRRKF